MSAYYCIRKRTEPKYNMFDTSWRLPDHDLHAYRWQNRQMIKAVFMEVESFVYFKHLHDALIRHYEQSAKRGKSDV